MFSIKPTLFEGEDGGNQQITIIIIYRTEYIRKEEKIITTKNRV